ncbi:MAG: hypothetical protein ACRD21_24990 [Vicinamibacteria bacterium]
MTRNATRRAAGVKQLTIRGFDEELERHIQRLARRESVSLNQAVLRLLRKGAGLGEGKDAADVVGSSLDSFIGNWSDDEAEAVELALKDFEEIDESMWK